MTPIEVFAAQTVSGTLIPYSCPSLNTAYDGSSKIFEPSQAAKTAAQIEGWSAVHMADWWSHLAHDLQTGTHLIAGGRDRFKALAQNLVSYNSVEDVWTQVPNWSEQPGGHCYQSSCAGNGKFYYVPSVASDGIQVWDIVGNYKLTPIPLPPKNVCPPHTSSWAGATALGFASWLGSQGSLVWVNCNGSADLSKALTRIARYDFALAQWLPVYSAKGIFQNQHVLALRSKHVDKMLVGSTLTTQQRPLGTVDSAGTFSLLPVGPMNANVSGSTRAMVFEHPLRNEWIVFCLSTSKIWSLPPGSSVWVDRGTLPADLNNPNTAALSMSFGAAFVRYRSNPAQSQMWVWKPDF